MKNAILMFCVLKVFGFNSYAIQVQTSDPIPGFSGSHNSRLKNAQNNGVSLPEIDFYPDTVSGGGQVMTEIIISDDLANFSDGAVYIFNPKGQLRHDEYFSGPSENGRYTFSFEIYEYDMPGYWYVGEIFLNYSSTGYHSFSKEDINKGFTVINTTPDTIPPQIVNYDISKDTVYPGDTALITMEVEDTLSGLAYYYMTFYDTLNNNYSFEYEELYGEKEETLNFEYVPGKYEMAGLRRIFIEIYDIAGNYISYNEDSLNFLFVVSGTIIDTIPPSFHNASVTNNSENDSILLGLVMKDDISGIEGFYVNLYNYDNDYYFDEDDFIKVNDSSYMCNLVDKYPYLSSGNYSISVNMNDSANNYSVFGQTGMFSILNVNSDNEPPKVLSVKFNKDTLISGDVINLQIILSDNKSGINSVYGEIRNAEDSRNSIWFEENLDEAEITEYTFSETFSLSEFGPGGQWKIYNLYIYDYAGWSNYNIEDLPSFYYYPKYIDNEPPVFNSISFDPSEINAGDTVTVTIFAYDNLSGIDEFDYNDDISDQDYFFGERQWIMTELNTYQTKIPVNKFTAGGYVNYELRGIRDRAGNFLNLNKEGTAFRINNTGETDNTPPIFDSLHISESMLNQEDTLELIFYIHDDLSGIDPTLVYAIFEQINEEDNDDYDDFFDLIFFPEYSDETSYKVVLPARIVTPGEYLFYSIFLADSAGNANDIGDYDYTDYNYVFEVTGEYDPDNEAPVLTDIIISPKVVEPNDTVSILIKVIEENSGLLTLFAYIRNTDGIERDELFFADWEIIQENDTFICSGRHIVPQHATNGKWIVESIELYDYSLNVASLEYNIDYSDADFLVTGGQSYPNRHPTWVIRDINLTLNANELLVYTIPDFIVADIDGDELSYSAGFNSSELPSWISFSSADLKLTLQPGENDGGNYTVYVFAYDPGGLKDSLEINIEVISYERTDNIIQNSEINIYPNPCDKYVIIDYSYSINTVSIYDLSGKIIYSSYEKCNRISVANIEKGVYILKIVTEKLTFIERLVIQ